MIQTPALHPTAIIEEGAKLADTVEIGAYAIVKSGAVLDEGVKVGPYTLVESGVKVGAKTQIGSHCIIGGAAQDVSGVAQNSTLIIGANNIIREHSSIHKGSSKTEGVTQIGDDNFIMAHVHIGHDCVIGNHNVIASFTGLSGHVILGDRVVLSGSTGVAQFVRIGSFVYTGGMTRVRKDVPPFLTLKEEGQVMGPNLVALKRNGFDAEQIKNVKSLYKIFYKGKMLLSEAINKAQAEIPDCLEKSNFLETFKGSKVGVNFGNSK